MDFLLRTKTHKKKFLRFIQKTVTVLANYVSAMLKYLRKISGWRFVHIEQIFLTPVVTP